MRPVLVQTIDWALLSASPSEALKTTNLRSDSCPVTDRAHNSNSVERMDDSFIFTAVWF